VLSWEVAAAVQEVGPTVVGAVPVTVAVSLEPTVLPLTLYVPPFVQVMVQPVMAKVLYGLPALYVMLKFTDPPADTAEGLGVVIATGVPVMVYVIAPGHPGSPPVVEVVIEAPPSASFEVDAVHEAPAVVLVEDANVV